MTTPPPLSDSVRRGALGVAFHCARGHVRKVKINSAWANETVATVILGRTCLECGGEIVKAWPIWPKSEINTGAKPYYYPPPLPSSVFPPTKAISSKSDDSGD